MEIVARLFGVWRDLVKKLRAPFQFNLRRNPSECAQHNLKKCSDRLLEQPFIVAPTQPIAPK